MLINVDDNDLDREQKAIICMLAQYFQNENKELRILRREARDLRDRVKKLEGVEDDYD